MLSSVKVHWGNVLKNAMFLLQTISVSLLHSHTFRIITHEKRARLKKTALLLPRLSLGEESFLMRKKLQTRKVTKRQT